MAGAPETLHERFGASWAKDLVRPKRTAKGAGCTMVTCDPNELVAPIHPKAMVTILHEADWDRWLSASYEDAVALQCPYPADKMTVRGPVFPTREKETA